VTTTTAVVTRNLCWRDYRRRRVRHHRRGRHIRRLHGRRGGRRVWWRRRRRSTTGRGSGMPRVRVHDLAIRLVRRWVSWSRGWTMQEVGVDTAVTGPQRSWESVTVW